jgi:fibronectin-binding autotransporter adhesin
MKPARKMFVGFLCATGITTATFGQGTGNASQTNFTWIAAGANMDLATAANWAPQGVPVPARNNTSTDYGDIVTFDGQTAGPVSATSNTGAQTGSSVGGTTAGLYLHLTANQTNSVTFHTTVANSASSGIRFNSITIDAGAGSFYFGKNSTTNALDTIWGTSDPESHGLINNSGNPAYILPDMRWRLGAGGAHTFIFGGTGDWYITNDLANIAGAATLIAKAGPGTMYWTAGHNAYWGSVTTISTPLTISGGTLVLKSGALFPATTTINNNGIALVYAAPASSQAGGAQLINNPINGTGALQVNNGTLTLSGANTYSGGTTISGGTLQVGAGGAGGSLGTGPVTDNSALVFNRSDTVVFTNIFGGSGSVAQNGSGTLTLSGASTYTGATTLGNGILLINGTNFAASTIVNLGTLGGTGALSGPVTLAAGTTLAPGASIGSVGKFTINNNLFIGGNMTIEVNKSLPQSNDLVVVSGVLTNTGTGTLGVTNLGPALAVGDKFTLFNRPLTNGAAMTVTGAGANWQNNLAMDGSITVTSVSRPMLNFAQTGNSLQFYWDTSFGAYKLQAQTDSLTVGLNTNWTDYPGGVTRPVTVTIDSTKETLFFRLVSPP